MEEMKYDMTRGEEMPLQLHFMSVRHRTYGASRGPEQMELVLAYRLEGAVQRMEEIYGVGPKKVEIKYFGYVNMSSLFSRVKMNTEQQTTVIKFVDDPVDTTVNSKRAYLFNLKYAKDEFSGILTKSDMLALDRIVNKIDKHIHSTDTSL